MNKKFSSLILALACASAIGVTAAADGPIGGTMRSIGRAAEDVAQGVGNAVSDAANGVGNAARDITGTTTRDTTSTTNSTNSINSTSGTSVTSTTSGIVAGDSTTNPAAGVTYGATAATAVTAAIAIVLAANRRKK